MKWHLGVLACMRACVLVFPSAVCSICVYLCFRLLSAPFMAPWSVCLACLLNGEKPTLLQASMLPNLTAAANQTGTIYMPATRAHAQAGMYLQEQDVEGDSRVREEHARNKSRTILTTFLPSICAHAQAQMPRKTWHQHACNTCTCAGSDVLARAGGGRQQRSARDAARTQGIHCHCARAATLTYCRASSTNPGHEGRGSNHKACAPRRPVQGARATHGEDV